VDQPVEPFAPRVPGLTIQRTRVVERCDTEAGSRLKTRYALFAIEPVATDCVCALDRGISPPYFMQRSQLRLSGTITLLTRGVFADAESH